jgi:hypothetical protein
MTKKKSKVEVVIESADDELAEFSPPPAVELPALPPSPVVSVNHVDNVINIDIDKSAEKLLSIILRPEQLNVGLVNLISYLGGDLNSIDVDGLCAKYQLTIYQRGRLQQLLRATGFKMSNGGACRAFRNKKIGHL